jgi:hypothetical protein
LLSESFSRGTGCLNWARPGLWGLRVGNRPVLPGKEMFCAMMFFCNNKHQGYLLIKGSKEYEKIKNNYINNVLKKRWTEEKRREEREKWTEEKREKWRNDSIKRYENWCKNNRELVKNRNQKLKQKVINSIIIKCRNNLSKKEQKERLKILKEQRKLEKKQIKKSMQIFNKGKKIICIENNTIYDSIKEASAKTGCYYGSIQRVLHGRKTHTHNLHFKFY